MASFPGGYPAARRLDLVEDLHGHRVADPYRWLEDADSPQTRQWSPPRTTLWAGYRAACRRGDDVRRPGARAAARRVRRPAGLARRRQFFMRRDPDQEHAVL